MEYERLLSAEREARAAAERAKARLDIMVEVGALLTGTLDSVPNLIRTCELSGTARLNVTRYGLALARLLPIEER